MKKIDGGFFWAIIVLLATSLACSFLTSISGETNPTAIPIPTIDLNAPTEQPENPQGQSSPSPIVETEFPLPPDAQNVQQVSPGDTIIFQVKLSIQDVVAFYREALRSQGYQEYQLLTSITDSSFSLVFRGKGTPIVVQGTEFNGLVAVSIRHDKTVE
jgi:hypothetical protein